MYTHRIACGWQEQVPGFLFIQLLRLAYFRQAPEREGIFPQAIDSGKRFQQNIGTALSHEASLRVYTSR